MEPARAKSTPGTRHSSRKSQYSTFTTYPPNPPNRNAQFFQARASRVKSILDPTHAFSSLDSPAPRVEPENRSVQFELRDSDPDSDLGFDFNASFKPKINRPERKKTATISKPVAAKPASIIEKNSVQTNLGESEPGDNDTPNSQTETAQTEPEIEERLIAETLNRQKEQLLKKRNELIKARELIEQQRKEDLERQRLLRIERLRRKDLEKQIEREKQRDKQRKVYLSEIRRLQPETQALEKQIELEEQRIEMMKQDTEKLQILDEDISNLVPASDLLPSPRKRVAQDSPTTKRPHHDLEPDQPDQPDMAHATITDRNEKAFDLINRMHEYDRAQRALNQPNSPFKNSSYPIPLESPVKYPARLNPTTTAPINGSVLHPTVLSTPRKPNARSELPRKKPNTHNYAVWSESQWREFSEALKETFDDRVLSPLGTVDALNALCKRFPQDMKNMELAEFVARMKVWVRKSQNLKR